MEEMIIVQTKPTELEHTVYIMSSNSEIIPIIIKCKNEELLSTITMSAVKYEINDIKIQGPQAYTMGVKEQLINKVNTCFGFDNKINITLM